MKKRLAGKVAIVTGGGKGIGAGIVARFREEGALVAILDRERPPGRAGTRTRFESCDVSDEAQVVRAVKAVVAWAGRLDIVVNNAGIAEPHGAPPEELSLEAWRRVLDTNLTGQIKVSERQDGIVIQLP